MSAPAAEAWALLDGLPGEPARLYQTLLAVVESRDDHDLQACWDAVQARQRAGAHALLLADYEWGARLQGVADWPADDAPGRLQVLLFAQQVVLSPAQAQAWLTTQDPTGETTLTEDPDQPGQDLPGPAAVLDARPSIDAERFTADIAAIQAAIRAGETYQVNHTYRWQGQLAGHPVALYRRLRALQPVAYGACICWPQPDGTPRWVLSRSPELFLRHDAATGCLQAEPMKGTAPRQQDPAYDAQAAQSLAADVKNRAENLMIVDLLRNDLGRLAQVGSVQVPQLFQVQALATVFQMTSTVQARPRPDVDVPALLRATFPCGSITGAPKRHTMGLIRQQETSPRGLYCGAIGWVDAPPAQGGLPSLAWSVAIRTLEVTQDQVRWGVGGGIVQDSVADNEHAETLWKSRFVFATDPGFALIETLRMTAGGELPWLDTHLARLRHSAARLRWPLDEAALHQRLQALAAQHANPAAAHPQAPAWRVRLTLAHDGQLGLTCAPLPPLPGLQPDPLTGLPGTVDLCWAAQPLAQPGPLATLKTTRRAVYDQAVREAEAQGCFDSLLVDAQGQVLEGGRSNLLVRLGGRWFTPPVAAGVLPGVARARLLADPAWGVTEATLHAADVHGAEALVVCNALRGPLRARLREAR
ncbi:chorismate-binding protein [Ideonella livida]|uniref:Chloride transporter n=1 Tax=Ideonella livida TaxID=2707176 RepID=A0A7C9TLG5_9BURK|nr:chorismate-binding protein [Ideonella livida]NDY93361.1 chloride transporter [Ideonella livida]